MEEEFDGRKVDLRVYQGPFASRQMGRVIEDRLNAVSLHILLLDSLVRMHLCAWIRADQRVWSSDPLYSSVLREFMTKIMRPCHSIFFTTNWKLFHCFGHLRAISLVAERRQSRCNGSLRKNDESPNLWHFDHFFFNTSVLFHVIFFFFYRFVLYIYFWNHGNIIRRYLVPRCDLLIMKKYVSSVLSVEGAIRIKT